MGDLVAVVVNEMFLVGRWLYVPKTLSPVSIARVVAKQARKIMVAIQSAL